MGEEGRKKKLRKMGIHASILVACAIAKRRRHDIISRYLKFESEKVRSEILTHLFSNANYCRSIIRMSPAAFLDLCSILVKQGGLRPTTRATIEEQVVKSLYLLGHNVTISELSVFFRRSGETVSRHFHNVLNAIMELEDKFLIQPDGSQIPSEIINKTRFYPYFKTSKAQITSLNQSRRIAELEAQLNETEGKILDLRAEISQAHDQLDTVKNSNAHLSNFNEKDDVICCDIAANEDQQITSPLTSCQFNKCHNITKQTPKDIAQIEKPFNFDRNLSSVILESKEPELYRNGCTHRIRAFERNLLDEKLLYGNFADELMPVKSDTLDNEHNHNVEKCALFSSNKDLDGMKNPVRLVKFPDHFTTVHDQPVKSCILQRKKSRNGKAKATLNSLHGNMDPKIQQQCSDIMHQKNNSIMGNEYEHSGLNLPTNKPEKMKLVEEFPKLDKKIHCDNNQAVFVPRRRIRKRKARYQDDDIDPSSVPPFLSRCKMNVINHDSISDLDCVESESNAEINEEANIVLASRHVTAEVKMDRDPRFGHNAEGKDDAFIESEVVKHSGNATKSIRVAKELSTVSNTLGTTKTEEATNGAASHVDRSGVLQKFSRKHKKEAAANLLESSSPEG